MKAKFFCESCGAEVRHNEKTCPSCGKTFTAVKCPRCAFEGGAKQFAKGCPRCGYLNVLPPSARADEAGDVRRTAPPVRAHRLPRLRLPARFYRVAVTALLLLLVGLIVLFAIVVRR